MSSERDKTQQLAESIVQNNSFALHNTSSLTTTKQASTVNDKYSEEEYSNYIDSSDVVIQTYKNSSAVGLEKYFLKIEEWLDKPLHNDEENKPYVIEADEGVGKKTLLVKWMEYHQTKKIKRYPDIILSHFASSGGNNANYFFAIYRILNKLREALDIQQKVELLEEKLRRYFSYWLNHCSDKLEKELKYGEKVNYDKVIIIIEGIDLFVDNRYNKEANVAFWLPKFFPKNIKLIVTCDKKSQANVYLRSIGCEIQNIPIDIGIVQSMVERHAGRTLFVNEQTRLKHLDILKGYDEKCKNQSFYKVFLCAFLPYPVNDVIAQEDIPAGIFEKMFEQLDYTKLKEINDTFHLMDFILEFYSNHIMSQDKFIKLIRAFTLTQKGLTFEELVGITGVLDEEWKVFIACFKIFVLNFKGLWIMNNEIMKRVVLEKYKVDHAELKLQHQEIAQVVGKITPNSIRKLEEQTYHLFMSKDYFKLKEIISTIENFLLLFNPNNKYDLCRYWQNLEEQGFDPVIEYNKAIEGFEMHYHPSSQDVFRIIVQISRFLKEFSDFETYFTPEFRHPPVKGTYEELDDIGLLRELLGLQIFQPTEAEESEKPDLDKFVRTPGAKIQEKKEKMKLSNKKESTLKKKNKDDDPYITSPAKTIKPVEQIREKKERKIMILSKIESLNVDIPSSREQFRKFYENHILEIMKQNNSGHADNEDELNGQEGSVSEDDSDKEDNQHEENNYFDKSSSHQGKSEGHNHGQSGFLEKSKQKKKKNQDEIISMSQLREADNLKERIPANYYYKRWLWVQFPWACLSLHCDYSAKLKECFSSPIEYMSIKKEKEFTKQALKIAIEAKLKKQMMYKRSTLSDSQSIIKPAGGGDSILIKSSLSVTNLPPLSATRKVNNEAGPTVGTSLLNSRSNTVLSSFVSPQKRLLKISNSSQPFFITDEYFSQHTLNKELEATPNAQAAAQASAPPIGKVENTSRVLEKSKVFKDKTKFFDPISSIQDSRNLSTILPRLKGGIHNHSTKELYLLENQALDMKRELDYLISTNKKLAHNLKELRFQEYNQNAYGTNPERINNSQNKVMELSGQINDTEDNYLLGRMQISRLRSILKICGDNKQQNEDWIRNLNYLLTNFRKMIRWEQEDIKVTKNECIQLQKINKEYVNVFQEKIEAQSILINQINTSIRHKERLDSLFNKTDSVIEQSACERMEKRKEDQKNSDNRKKQRDRQNQLEKNSKQISEQLEKIEAQYNKLKEVIDISDSNYTSSDRFQQLLAAREKRDDLTCIVLQRQDVLSSLQAKLKERQSYLETVKKAYPGYSQMKSSEEQDSQEVSQVQPKLAESQIQQEKGKEDESSSQQAKQENKQPSSQPNENAELNTKEENYFQLIQKLENDLENKQRHYNKMQQVRLSASMTISTMQKKLAIDQGADVRSTIDFEVEKITSKLDEKINIIEEKLPNEDFQDFRKGKYDFSKVYLSLVADAGSNNNPRSDDEDDEMSRKEF